ncbi:MAG TPA: hypothetical protein ENK49_11510 [Gammaproteobacteria bacterium]|nr:hypothetical protein [Gammaproteobacteria bacterium]
MKIDSALSQAMLGIQRGLASARDHAGQIANAGQFSEDSPASLVEPLLGLRQDRIQVQASAQVLKAVDDMLGTLFDDKA